MDNKETFDHLRNLAKLKCDQDVEFARKTLKERLADIDQMETELGTIVPTVVRQIKTRRKKGVPGEGLLRHPIPSGSAGCQKTIGTSVDWNRATNSDDETANSTRYDLSLSSILVTCDGLRQRPSQKTKAVPKKQARAITATTSA